MDVTTMLLTKKTLQRVKRDYPQFVFKQGPVFAWSPQQETIYYNLSEKKSDLLLLHELSHAILGHSSYAEDIALLEMEQEAWSRAVKLASHYKIKIDQNFIEEQLDSYRAWLYSRSLCPNCKNSGVQTKKLSYLCPICNTTWQANSANNTELRRYITKK